MDKKLACVGRAIPALRFRLSLALLATLVTASEFGPVAAVPTASILGTTTFQAPTLRVWAAVSVDRPIFGIDQAINVTFAATNLGDVPIRLTALREDTVLLINGKEWPGSAFTFANGAHSTAQFLPAGIYAVYLSIDEPL